ncbi:acyl-CoA dehydrogenase family protein [Bacteroidales bacterium AH-315-I05]|nr:acyl-CoA dehydrogenase family protein [Bacteroidales bacterium AH-315-I05]
MNTNPFNPFTEEHELLAQSLRDFLKKEVTPYVDQWEKDGHCPPEIFQKMGEQGFFGVSYPEEVGGSGMDLWAAVIVAREIAYANCGGLALSMYAHAYLPPPLINAVGTEAQKIKYLIPALKGEKICALGVTEPGAGSDVGGIKTKAEDMGDHWLINGSKTFITNGNIADFILLAARTGEGHTLSLFLFDTSTEGYSSQPVGDKLGMHSSDTALCFFDNCKIPKDALVGDKDFGFYYIMNNFQEERLIGAIMGTYAAEFALEKAKKYCQEREAFGRKIGGFQVVRHKLAQMAIKVETCRSIAFRAIYEYIEKGPMAVGIISMAKAYVSETCMEVINEALQLHGGNGYMEEFGIARAWRDCRLMTIGAGTTEIMHEIVSKLIVDDVKHEKILMDTHV